MDVYIQKVIRDYVKENGRSALRSNAKSIAQDFPGQETKAAEIINKFLSVRETFTEEGGSR